MSTDYEPSAEQVEALADELRRAFRGGSDGGVDAGYSAEARFVLRRQHERERGLTRNLRRISECVSIEWARHIATATLAAHAALDAPKVPTLLEAAKAAEAVPGTRLSGLQVGCECVAVPLDKWNALKAAVEREERGA